MSIPSPDPHEPGPEVRGRTGVDGRSTRWSGQQERRRAEFVEAALIAIDRHGPDVSTEQIASVAGVARTRLYRHFAGAGELNQQVASRAEQMVLEALAPAWDPTASPDTIIRTAVSTHLGWLTRHHSLYRYLVRHSVTTASGESAVNDVKRLIADHLVSLLEEYVVLLGLDARVVRPLSYGLVGFVDAAAERWVAEPHDLALEDMVDLLSSWIWSVIDGVLQGEGISADPTTPLLPASG